MLTVPGRTGSGLAPLGGLGLLAVPARWSVSLTFCLYLRGHRACLAGGRQMAFDSWVS